MNKMTLLVLGLASVLSSPGLAYPPDNAAVLYYRAFSLMEYPEEKEIHDAIWDYAKGRMDITDPVVYYLDKHKHVIKMVLDAGTVTHCDWGLDYSEGIDMLFPKLAPARHAGFTVLAQARRDFQAGHVDRAFDLCFAVHRMGRHVDNDCMISRLVGIALNALTNGVMRDFLGAAPLDEYTLTQLKSRILEITSYRNTLKAAVQKESMICTNSICLAGQASLLKCLQENGSEKSEAFTRIQAGDVKFLEESLQYYLSFMTDSLNALDLPFSEAYARLVELEKKPAADVQNDPVALITAIHYPALWQCLCLDVRCQTDFNALKTGLEILLMKARTGHLPESLPLDMPKDLFSGRDFVYEKDKDGFVLLCQAPDPSKEEVLAFSFGLP